MNGELKQLRTHEYLPTYEISDLMSYSFQRVSVIKLEIESELHLMAKKLEANNVNMETPLVSSDGFPRSDINLVEIRTVRVKIIKLKNDLRAVLEELSNRMTQQFQSQLETPPSSAMASLQVSLPVSFAIVSEVVTDGPAHRSGLQIQDRIVKFGDIDATNHNDLKNVAYLVKNKQEQNIEISILRGDTVITVLLVPTTDWPGHGLLGCRLNQL